MPKFKLPDEARQPNKVMGRPEKWRDGNVQLAYRLALTGCTEAEMADIMEVDITTFHDWKHNYADFSQAILDGGVRADGNVAMAMYKRATGFKHKAVKIFHNKDDGTVVVPYMEYYPPDVAAGNRWLANRQRKYWKADPDNGGGAPGTPLINLTINTSDPIEAAKVYQQLIGD